MHKHASVWVAGLPFIFQAAFTTLMYYNSEGHFSCFLEFFSLNMLIYTEKTHTFESKIQRIL
jgi:hypothetical protein